MNIELLLGVSVIVLGVWCLRALRQRDSWKHAYLLSRLRG